MNFTKHGSKPLYIQNRRWEPVTAVSSIPLATAKGMANVAVDVFAELYKEYKRRHHYPNASVGTKDNQEKSHLEFSQANSGGVLPEVENLPGKAGIVNDCNHTNNELHTAGAMALASATSLGKVFVGLSQGVLVDILVAAVDGMRAIPQLHCHEVKDYGKVTDWKSGTLVAGKTFGHGIYEGFSDIFIQTYQGKRKEGATGVAKGLAKGLVSMTSVSKKYSTNLSYL
jgi:hypothetical protein